MTRPAGRLWRLVGVALVVFIGAVFVAGELRAAEGTVYTSRNDWLAAAYASLSLSENFESFAVGWNNSPAVRSWGRIESTSPNPYAIWIENAPLDLTTKSLEAGSPIITLRPNQQSIPLVAFGFDYIGLPELQLFNAHHQSFLTVDPEAVYAYHPAQFFGWVAAPGQSLSEFTYFSLIGHSLMDNLTFGFRAVPEPSAAAMLSCGALVCAVRRRRDR